MLLVATEHAAKPAPYPREAGQNRPGIFLSIPGRFCFNATSCARKQIFSWSCRSGEAKARHGNLGVMASTSRARGLRHEDQKTRLSSSALWRKARNFFIDATRGERAETVAKDKGRETRRLSARRCGRFPTCATDQCLTESENRLMTTTPAMMSPRPMYAGRSRCCLK